ncbi:hypothetical protein H2508_00405 [Parahaliea sp. F7430]|uniref:DnaT DNA-binding domain-containing protein n=1 Tax=Sediminihaliea albiluteola TaxID=2758564 RepID=A0A7W2TTI8_9GAMM|nr:DnaT-like ssDNA-binding domain-containing protein [Sediminihaliea albiluteola]MBA6411580.1 hypothetical protein [Sediminihaliea albiluteola]
MSESSLVPEQALAFSPGLAATIGLEETILLQYLHGLFQHREAQLRDDYAWLSVERDFLLRQLPFWEALDLHRIVRSLVDKGVLLVASPPLHSADCLIFALNEPQRSTASPTPQPIQQPSSPSAPARPRSATQLAANWSPSEDLLQLLTLNHNIPREFALDQLEDFIFYWRERGEINHAWENKFRQHVTTTWRRHQQQQAEAFRQGMSPALDQHWRPSPDAMDIMIRSGVEQDFIEQAIPEFILYWRERGSPPKELNTRFIQHVRVQWARYTSSVAHSTEPTRISKDWQPGPDVYDILRMSHIDEQFARNLVAEFIIYWRDSNQAHTSWNSKFLQHVKFHWAKQHQMQQVGRKHDGQQPGSNPTGRTRDTSLADDLSDTSWAK